MKKHIKKIILIAIVVVILVVIAFLLKSNLTNKISNNQERFSQNIVAKNSQKIDEQLPENKNTAENEEVKDIKKQGQAMNEAGEDLAKPIKTDIILGNKNAPVTIIEYASLSCPHCAAFYEEAFVKLKKEYIDTNKVKYIYRDFPLNQPALAASILSLCQFNDHKNPQNYYKFLEILFKAQDDWAFAEDFTEKLRNIAVLDGISAEKFAVCMKDSHLQEQILKSRLEAAKLLEIKSTPTFFINDEVISGYNGWKNIKNKIELHLTK